MPTKQIRPKTVTSLELWKCLVVVVFFGACLGPSGHCASANESAVSIGQRVGNLAFKDIRYLERSLADFNDKKAVVVVCINTTCPLVKKYLPKLKRLEQTYRQRGVQFVALNVGSADSIRDMAAFAIEHELTFPSVQDIGAQSTVALGVQRTPEVAVIDAGGRLRYRGRIDNQYRIGGTLPKASENNLKDALDALLAGRKIAVEKTPVDGCAITRPIRQKSDRVVTFTEHVQPLIHTHCSDCHKPNTEAPFSLRTYGDVHDHAEMIAEVVSDQRMPPWYADSKHGEFTNKRGMTRNQRDTISQWVENGMPRGEAVDTPIPQTDDEPSGENWLIGKPDHIIRMFGKHTLPADGYIPYKYTILPYIFVEDTWVQSVQILPSNPAVLHHCNMGIVVPGGNETESQFVTGKVPGGMPLLLNDGVAVLIPKGSALVLQIHYTTTGQEETCKLSVGLKYPKNIVHKRLRHLMITNRKFAIVPGASHHKVTASRTFDCDATGVGLFAHMHVRGKDMTFIAHDPDGKTDTLLRIPNYNFDWQLGYVWQPGKKRFSEGTRVECVAHYDNSTFNPYNPDATATVKHGPQTYHEMLFGFLFYTATNEDLNLTVNPKTGRVVP